MARDGLYRHLNEVQIKVERQLSAVHAGPLVVAN